MIGNSSSGIVESCSFNMPTINLGTRQKGKVMPKNVINSTYNTNNLSKLLLTLKKKKNINPYEKRFSMKRITNIILNLKITDKLLRKKFISIY